METRNFQKKIQGIVMGWEKTLSLQYKNWDDDEEKFQTQRENKNFLEWLDREETLMSEK